jgi:lysyl-tRNA synthetase class 2
MRAAMDHQTNSMSSAPSASLPALLQRATLLRSLREFFHSRGFIEVETPLLSAEVIPELHIEPIVTTSGEFLQASPELHMKRLLAAGATAIFQVTRSFRDGERGQLHNPEFTIVEWYRAGDDMYAGIQLLDELLHALLNTPPARRTTYAEAFQRHLQICPHTCALEALRETAIRTHVDTSSIRNDADRDEWLNLLLATRVEPQLGLDRPEIIYHYPASQASLSQLTTDDAGNYVAERFELYYRGIELANGFHELTDAQEQRRRFEEINATRLVDGRRALPLPDSLLAALEHGLPKCTGVALGFDRLAMLAIGAHCIDEVLAFPTAICIP